jgi:hypothetical protein
MRLAPRFTGIVFFVTLTLNSNLSSAQVRFGPKVGLNFSGMPNNTNYIIGNQHIYNGYHFGGITEFRLYGQLFLQPGVLITNRGSKYIVGNSASGSTTGYSYFQFYTFNADIPVNLKYNFDFGTFKFVLLAGPQVGYGFSGKWAASNRTSTKVHFGNDPTDDLKPFDYGLNLGGGLEVGRIQLTSQYYMGLRSLSPQIPPLKEQKYKMVSLSIAFLFGSNRRDSRDYKSRYMHKHRNSRETRKKHY